MKIVLHLADAAQPDQVGKVGALGLGWAYVATPLPPHAIVAFLEVGQDEADIDHRFTIDLVNEDGKHAAINGQRAFHGDGEVRITSDPGAVPGAPIVHAFAFPVPGGLSLPAGKRWEYRLESAGATGSVVFATRP